MASACRQDKVEGKAVWEKARAGSWDRHGEDVGF
jgi:hypothetical protein